MRLPAIAVSCLLMVPFPAVQPPANRSSDETAVREVIGNYVNARELRDPTAIESLFTADADQQTTAGDWRRGRAEIVPGTLESSRQNAGTRTITVESVRFLTPDVAIADGPYIIAASGGAATRRMRTTIVLTRESGGWRIAAIRNMTPTRVP
jgi:uncharacterized protein (TIGR02246 family)